jgi:hypothetical protein
MKPLNSSPIFQTTISESRMIRPFWSFKNVPSTVPLYSLSILIWPAINSTINFKTFWMASISQIRTNKNMIIQSNYKDMDFIHFKKIMMTKLVLNRLSTGFR